MKIVHADIVFEVISAGDFQNLIFQTIDTGFEGLREDLYLARAKLTQNDFGFPRPFFQQRCAL